MARSDGGTWMAFLAMSFLLVGLTGIFATFATPVPLQRALQHEEVLDQALATATAPQPQAALEALRPALGDAADAVIAGPGDLPTRVAQARRAMRARFEAEEAEVALRVRILVGVFTVAGALFGAAILSVVRRAR